MKKLLMIILLLSAKADAQVYAGMGAGFSFTRSKPVAELQVGIADKNLVVQGGFMLHLDNETPALINAQVGGRIYSGQGTGWQLTGGYCYQLISNDNKARNNKTYIISAQMFRPIGWGQWYVSGNYTPGYFAATFGIRGVFN